MMASFLRSNRLALTLVGVCVVGVSLESIRWVRARDQLHKLMASSGPDVSPRTLARRTQKARPKLTREDYVSLCKFLESNTVAASGTPRTDVTAILEHIGDLNAAQIQALTYELQTFGHEVTQWRQREIIQFAVEALAKRDPKSAITVLNSLSKGTDAICLMETAVPAVLMIWHQQDAAAASQWIRQQIQSGESFVNWADLSKLPGALATRDPALAFALMAEMQQRGMKVEVAAVTRNASNDPARSAALASMRQLQQSGERGNLQLAEGAWRGFAANLTAAGPAASGQWLESASLTDSEKVSLSAQLIAMEEPRDRAYWLAWMAGALSPQAMPAQVGAMVTSWARANHREAGTFITTMPDGEAKNSAVQAFATTVAKIDPTAAEQWALTLPSGPRRDTTLQQIRANAAPEGHVSLDP